MKPKSIIYSFVLLVLPMLVFSQKGIINEGSKIVVVDNTSIILEEDMEIVNQNNGTIDLDGMIQIESDITNNSSSNNLFINTDNVGTVVLNGAVEQNLNGSNTIALDKLEVSSAGVQLNTNIEQEGNLFINAGKIYLNDYNYLLGSNSTISGLFSTNNMFVINGIGEVRKTFTSSGLFIYPIGEDTELTNYSPVILNISSISANNDSYIGATVTDQKFNRNTSTSEYLTRFWTLTGSGVNSVNFSATFYYVDEDVEGIESSIYATVFTEASQIPYNQVNDGENSFSVNSQNEFAVYTGANGVSDIAELFDERLLIFPNPASSSVNVILPGNLAGDFKLDLLNQQGIIIKNDVLKEMDFSTDYTYSVELEDLSSGLYILRFISNSEIYIKKLIIE